MTTTLDFRRSYLRFYIEFEEGRVKTLSHRPPTQTNRTRILLEASCRLTHRESGASTLYVLSAACKTEQVGARKGDLWIEPNADVIFLSSDDGQFAIHKSWQRNDPGVMLVPPELGPQPERQVLRASESFDDVQLDLHEAEARVLNGYDAVAAAILGTAPLVSRIAYTDGDFEVVLDQPVKTINLCERDRLFQTDTGPVLLPDLRPERFAGEELPIGVFDLAFSAFHARDWAEFIVNVRTPVADQVTINHYSRPRLVEPTFNQLLVLP